jgi:hypothetical protein
MCRCWRVSGGTKINLLMNLVVKHLGVVVKGSVCDMRMPEGIQKKPIGSRIQGIKKAPDPGSGSATLNELKFRGD